MGYASQTKISTQILSAVVFTMGVLAIFSTGTYGGIGMVCRVWKCSEKCHKKKKMLVLLRRTSFWPPSMVYISVQMLQIFIWASEGSFHVLHLSVHNSTTKPPRLDDMVYTLNLKYGVYFKSQRSCIISNLIIFKYLSRFEPVTFRSWSRWHTNMLLGHSL